MRDPRTPPNCPSCWRGSLLAKAGARSELIAGGTVITRSPTGCSRGTRASGCGPRQGKRRGKRERPPPRQLAWQGCKRQVINGEPSMTVRAERRPQPTQREGPLHRVLNLFTDVRPGEAGTALLLTLNIFLLLSCYYIIKPLREALI